MKDLFKTLRDYLHGDKEQFPQHILTPTDLVLSWAKESALFLKENYAPKDQNLALEELGKWLVQLRTQEIASVKMEVKETRFRKRLLEQSLRDLLKIYKPKSESDDTSG